MSEMRPKLAAEQIPMETRQTSIGVCDERIVHRVSNLNSPADRMLGEKLLAPLQSRRPNTIAQPVEPRPAISFKRLTFTPLDPILIPATAWRRSTLGVPRTAIKPLAAKVRREIAGGAVGNHAAEIRALLAGPTDVSASALLQRGSILWPMAAAILRAGPPPAEWNEATGLTEADHATISRACATVLETAAEIHAMAAGVALGLAFDAGLPARLLAGASGMGKTDRAVLIATLLSRFPSAQGLIASIGETAAGMPELDQDRSSQSRRRPFGPQGRLAVDAAFDFMLDKIEADDLDLLEVNDATDEATRIVGLLDALDFPGPCFRPSRKPRTEPLRRDLDSQLRRRFSAELRGRIAEAETLLSRPAGDADLEDLEAAMRDLRHFEGAARRLGGAEHYDRELKSAAAAIGGMRAPVVERMRLVELLMGTDAALRLLPSRAPEKAA